MRVEAPDVVESDLEVSAADVVFDTLPALGMDRMTDGRVEFVLCVSALTAQV
jgi:hypothetical protein